MCDRTIKQTIFQSRVPVTCPETLVDHRVVEFPPKANTKINIQLSKRADEREAAIALEMR